MGCEFSSPTSLEQAIPDLQAQCGQWQKGLPCLLPPTAAALRLRKCRHETSLEILRQGQAVAGITTAAHEEGWQERADGQGCRNASHPAGGLFLWPPRAGLPSSWLFTQDPVIARIRSYNPVVGGGRGREDSDPPPLPSRSSAGETTASATKHWGAPRNPCLSLLSRLEVHGPGAHGGCYEPNCDQPSSITC